MSNKAHIIYLNQKGYVSSIDALRYLGTVPNDAARNSISPLVVGNTVTVTSSAEQNNKPAFYHWNGSEWEVVASNWAVTQMANLIMDNYTKAQIDSKFSALGFLPPVATISARASLNLTDVPLGAIVSVLNNGFGKMSLFQLKSKTPSVSWVRIADEDWNSLLGTYGVAIAELQAQSPGASSWKAAVDTEADLSALPSSSEYDTRIVKDSEGNSILYVYKNSTWVPYFGTLFVDTVSDLTSLNTKLISAQVDNAVVFVEDGASFYWFNRADVVWTKVSSSPLFDSNRPITRTSWPVGVNLNKTTIVETLEALLYPPVYPLLSVTIDGGDQREFGASNVVTLNWEVTKKTYGVTAIDISGEAVAPGGAIDSDADTDGSTQSNTTNVEATQNVDSLLSSSVTDNQGNTTVTDVTLLWRNKAFWFVSDTDLTVEDDSDISVVLNALTSSNFEFSTDRQRTKTLIGEGQYLYVAYLNSYGGGADNMLLNNLPNNDWVEKVFTYQNVHSHSATFKLLRSGNKVNSSFTIQII